MPQTQLAPGPSQNAANHNKIKVAMSHWTRKMKIIINHSQVYAFDSFITDSTKREVWHLRYILLMIKSMQAWIYV